MWNLKHGKNITTLTFFQTANIAPDSTVDFPTLYLVTLRQYIPSLFFNIILSVPRAYTASILSS